ncbi:MAG: hypothetical protein ACP5O2_10550 [Bacteroidales bacterium]
MTKRNLIFRIINLFSKNNNKINPPETEAEKHEIPRNLFVNDNPPSVLAHPKETKPEEVTSVPEKVEVKGILQEFLERDHFTTGYADGYRFHSGEIKNNKISVLLSEFRNLVKIRIEQVNAELLHIDHAIINLEGLSEPMTQKIKLTRENLVEQRNRLQHELELSVDKEGLVAQVIHTYEDGFLRGTEQWFEESSLLGFKPMLK